MGPVLAGENEIARDYAERKSYLESPTGSFWNYLGVMTGQLANGDRLPPLMATDLEGNEVDMTAKVAGSWAVIMYYRGDW